MRFSKLPLLLFGSWLFTGCAGDETVPESFVRPEAWDEATLEVAATLPIQQGGRVMPLQSFAGFLMLAVNGKRSLKLPSGEKLDETGFLLDMLFYPEQANDYACFVVANSEVLDLIEVPSTKRRDRYSYNDLAAQRKLLEAQALEASKRENKNLLDKQLLGLERKMRSYEAALSTTLMARAQLQLPDSVELEVLGGETPRGVSFLFAEWAQVYEALRNLPDREEANRFLTALDDLGDLAHAAPAIFPPETTVSAEEQWFNPVAALYNGLTDPEAKVDATAGWMASLETLGDVRDDREAFRAELTRLRDGVKGEASRRGEYGKIASEVRLFNMGLVMKALVFFLLGFIVAAFSWLFGRSRWLPRVSLGASVAGTAMVVLVVTWRSVLRDRPPVSTLYDTILFITGVGAIACLVMEAINRKRVGLALAPTLGSMGMFLAFRYEVKDAGMSGDTLGQLQAVLDTNFWLATHVTSITAGYAAGLVATVISVAWILCRVLGIKRGNAAFYRDMTKMAYGAICFGLLLSVVGTILGGVWANESWGRFWGWDPKENGALLICITQLILLHARMGGYIKQHGLHALSCFQGGVICFSWWGVNELEAGLHSYGRTEGVLFYLTVTYSFLGVMAGLAGVMWLVERARAGGGPPAGGAADPGQAG